jgi:hypothetical protein
VPAIKPEIADEKGPLPEPLFTMLFAKVGLLEVLQQIPLELIELPPISVMLPPLEAPLALIELAAVVVNTGNVGDDVVKLISLP